MTSVIGGMEDTIAQTMAQIGWPGADQVQPEDDEPVVNEAPEPEEPEVIEQEEEEPAEEPESPEEEAPVAPEEQSASYRPKWKKAALAILDELPAEKKAQLVAEDQRREENFHKGIEQYRTGHANAKEWDEVITPYRATIDQFQVKPQEAVKQLLATDHILRYGQPHQKIGTILQAMQNYGINPQDIVALVQNTQQQTPQDPAYQQLNQRLSVYEQREQQRMQEAEQARLRQERETSTSLNAKIEAFAADPDHEHFETLKPMMAGFLQTGAAKDLDDAYEMAFKAHPQTNSLWVAQQQKQWAEANRAKVAKAKTVTNVRSNGRASVSSPTAPATMEETIRLQAEKLGLI